MLFSSIRRGAWGKGVAICWAPTPCTLYFTNTPVTWATCNSTRLLHTELSQTCSDLRHIHLFSSRIYRSAIWAGLALPSAGLSWAGSGIGSRCWSALSGFRRPAVSCNEGTSGLHHPTGSPRLLPMMVWTGFLRAARKGQWVLSRSLLCCICCGNVAIDQSKSHGQAQTQRTESRSFERRNYIAKWFACKDGELWGHFYNLS